MQNESHVQNAAHGQHTQHIRDTGHTSEMGRNHHKGYTQCEPYTQHKGTLNGRFTRSIPSHVECVKPAAHRHTRDCKLCYCHHPSCHAAFSTLPQLGLGGPMPLLAVYRRYGSPGVGFWRGGPCPGKGRNVRL